MSVIISLPEILKTSTCSQSKEMDVVAGEGGAEKKVVIFLRIAAIVLKLFCNEAEFIMNSFWNSPDIILNSSSINSEIIRSWRAT